MFYKILNKIEDYIKKFGESPRFIYISYEFLQVLSFEDSFNVGVLFCLGTIHLFGAKIVVVNERDFLEVG